MGSSAQFFLGCVALVSAAFCVALADALAEDVAVAASSFALFPLSAAAQTRLAAALLAGLLSLAARLSGQVCMQQGELALLSCRTATTSATVAFCVQCQSKKLRSLGDQNSPRLMLSLIDSIGNVPLATELDKDVVQSYLIATLATPNQLIQLTMCCSQAQKLPTTLPPIAQGGWATPEPKARTPSLPRSI